jgi:hypothetical protein
MVMVMMKELLRASVALSLVASQAAPAAEAASLVDGGRQSGAFAGAYFRLPLSGERAAASTARAGLRLGIVHRYRDVRAPSGGLRVEGEALDFGFAADGGASLRLAGQPLAAPAQRFAAGDERGSRWWIPVAVLGGAALIGGVVFLATVAEGNRNSD